MLLLVWIYDLGLIFLISITKRRVHDMWNLQTNFMINNLLKWNQILSSLVLHIWRDRTGVRWRDFYVGDVFKILRILTPRLVRLQTPVTKFNKYGYINGMAVRRLVPVVHKNRTKTRKIAGLCNISQSFVPIVWRDWILFFTFDNNLHVFINDLITTWRLEIYTYYKYAYHSVPTSLTFYRQLQTEGLDNLVPVFFSWNKID